MLARSAAFHKRSESGQINYSINSGHRHLTSLSDSNQSSLYVARSKSEKG